MNEGTWVSKRGASDGKANPRVRRWLGSSPFLLLLSACSMGASGDESDPVDPGKIIAMAPGDDRFVTPVFEDYSVDYNSRTSKTGLFTVQVRKTGSGEKISVVDIIPTEDNVIVAQRQIDADTHNFDFSAGPYLAWGTEFVVAQNDSEGYNWTRVPVGSSPPQQMTGKLDHNGSVSEMFSPTLASLMPMPVGTVFTLPEVYPRKGEFVSAELDQYTVLRSERLTLESGLSCDCWVLEKKAWSGTIDHIWVSRKAPFEMRRIRDVGGRDFQSDAQNYREL
ncbi:hypothetical protein [Pontixanthobacter sp. CEM42]|uniref:hypothetical protein n=1 Tax=Pontixanthobacter sp. CEM42 TaxID=2792077 RepID=UPI001AE09338|nr:hypothetical protein [Pontixanthobacter sp. CEM42]